ncbi:hypothetical protein [Phaffia rhodozyma]|uniref:Histone chaperone domain CHZ n=1 Tax=Phaffia rhodozyma TaxID=264483 RepID=A0A0F7SEV8_PHARH|nr:hypothetical protein [Phaffia rhodozyma]
MSETFAPLTNPPVDTQAEDSVAPGVEEGKISTVDLTTNKRGASDENEEEEEEESKTTKKPKLTGTGQTKTAETAAAEASLVEPEQEPVEDSGVLSPLPSPRFEGVDPDVQQQQEETAEDEEDEEKEVEEEKETKEKAHKKKKKDDEEDSDSIDSDEEIDEDELAFLDQTAIIPDEEEETAGTGRRSSRRGAAKVDYVKANLELGGDPNEED